ncbi:MAG: hypothetical protein ACR2NP_18865, partial [Pirellulaceae bacterium]
MVQDNDRVDPSSDSGPSASIRSRNRKIWWLLAILLLVGIWLLGDWVYSRVVDRAIQRWEATIER